jgi:hypothetical protein
MVDYITIIGSCFPGSEAYTSGDPAVYNNIVWVTAPISQATLDASPCAQPGGIVVPNVVQAVLAAPTKGEVVSYDTATSTWKNKSIKDILGGATPGEGVTIKDLQDVNIATPTTGQVLGYNGTQWVNQTNTGNSGSTVLSKSVVANVLTTAGPSNIFSFNVPGGTLGTTGILRLKLAGSWSNISGFARTATIAVSYGATTLYSDTSLSLATGTQVGWNMELILYAVSSTQSQRLVGDIRMGSTGSVTTGNTGDLSTDETLAQAQIASAPVVVNSDTNQPFNVTVTFSGSTVNWVNMYHTLELL